MTLQFKLSREALSALVVGAALHMPLTVCDDAERCEGDVARAVAVITGAEAIHVKRIEAARVPAEVVRLER